MQDVVKLLDFGLVKTKEEGSASTGEDDAESEGAGDLKLTQAGHILGTPAYLSPEQARRELADARSDIYAVGAVAYYLLTGQPPFLRATLAQMLRAHTSEPPVPPSEIRAGIDKNLEAVILRCLSKDPAERYQNATELDRALRTCRSALDWDARRAASWWQSHPQLTTTTASSS